MPILDGTAPRLTLREDKGDSLRFTMFLVNVVAAPLELGALSIGTSITPVSSAPAPSQSTFDVTVDYVASSITLGLSAVVTVGMLGSYNYSVWFYESLNANQHLLLLRGVLEISTP